MSSAPNSSAASPGPIRIWVARNGRGLGLIVLTGLLLSAPGLWLRRYGEGYNDHRKQLGIPLVEPGWQVQYARSTGNAYFFDENRDAVGHVRKTVRVSYLSGIEEESDTFVFKGVAMFWTYSYGRPNPWEIQYKGRRTVSLTYQQAIDSLTMLRRRL